jgi:hypothetical protein
MLSEVIVVLSNTPHSAFKVISSSFRAVIGDPSVSGRLKAILRAPFAALGTCARVDSLMSEPVRGWTAHGDPTEALLAKLCKPHHSLDGGGGGPSRGFTAPVGHRDQLACPCS